MPMRHIAYSLQEPFKRELERLQEQQILASLGVDEMAKCCNTFIILHTPNAEYYYLYTLQDSTSHS